MGMLWSSGRGWGEQRGLASGTSRALGAESMFSQELSGSQSWFSTARTHSESDATFQDLTASLTTEVEDGELGEPKVAPVCCGKSTLGAQRMGEAI